ncbi:4Fe-4S binding protein [bacterium]|nr:4Fe-4S binding protein [bacterium]
MSHRQDGVLRNDDLVGHVPSSERLAQGPIAVIECIENIPCNPCVDACPRGAISIEGDINGMPLVDDEKCNGCTICLSACPGLAIFVVDAGKESDVGTVSLPYEYRPLPSKGEQVDAVDRAGDVVCGAKVVRVRDTKALDRTPIVTIEVPRDRVMDVRHFRRRTKTE